MRCESGQPTVILATSPRPDNSDSAGATGAGASCTLRIALALVNRRGEILVGRRPSFNKPGKGGSQGWP